MNTAHAAVLGNGEHATTHHNLATSRCPSGHPPHLAPQMLPLAWLRRAQPYAAAVPVIITATHRPIVQTSRSNAMALALPRLGVGALDVPAIPIRVALTARLYAPEQLPRHGKGSCSVPPLDRTNLRYRASSFRVRDDRDAHFFRPARFRHLPPSLRPPREATFRPRDATYVVFKVRRQV